jgi:hypothetical protein
MKLHHRTDLTDIFRIFHPTAAGHTFFSTTHGTFYILGHKAGPNTHIKNGNYVIS